MSTNWSLVFEFGAVALLAVFIFVTIGLLLWLGYWMLWRLRNMRRNSE